MERAPFREGGTEAAEVNTRITLFVPHLRHFVAPRALIGRRSATEVLSLRGLIGHFQNYAEIAV